MATAAVGVEIKVLSVARANAAVVGAATSFCPSRSPAAGVGRTVGKNLTSAKTRTRMASRLAIDNAHRRAARAGPAGRSTTVRHSSRLHRDGFGGHGRHNLRGQRALRRQRHAEDAAIRRAQIEHRDAPLRAAAVCEGSLARFGQGGIDRVTGGQRRVELMRDHDGHFVADLELHGDHGWYTLLYQALGRSGEWIEPEMSARLRKSSASPGAGSDGRAGGRPDPGR